MKLIMMFSAIAIMLSGSKASWAGEENFEKRKAEAVAELDERIQQLQQHKTCVSAAANHEALQQCRASMKEWRQSERLEHMEKRKARIDERMQKLKEKKETPPNH